jgi:hypothetical protein
MRCERVAECTGDAEPKFATTVSDASIATRHRRCNVLFEWTAIRVSLWTAER